MNETVINFPRETTAKRLTNMQKAIAAASGAAAADLAYKALVAEATTKEEVDSLFIEWWKSQYTSSTSKVDLLERWFGNVLDDDRIHGVKFPLFKTSNTAIGELTDDSKGLSCTPSTSVTAGKDDFAHLPQFWCLEVSAEKGTDGTHTIYYVEHIDDIAKVRSGEHLTWVLQKNTYTKEYDKDGYRPQSVKLISSNTIKPKTIQGVEAF